MAQLLRLGSNGHSVCLRSLRNEGLVALSMYLIGGGHTSHVGFFHLL